MNTLRYILFLTLICFFVSCGSVEKSTIRVEPVNGVGPYSNLERLNDGKNFQFAIVTDRTGGHRPGVFEEGIRKINLLQPEFVMSVGDFIEGYTEDTVELDRQWDEFTGFIDSLQAPFFYVPGNHDITNKVMKDKWIERFGRTFYHFVYKDVLFLCLNSEDNYRGAGRGTIDDEQFEWIRKTLDENKDVKWTLLFMHQPLWDQQEETLRWKDVETLLAGRKHTVYVGHRHNYTRFERNNSKYFILATTGGGSPLRGTKVGEFDHVVWITMTDDGPIMANLLLEGVWGEDVVTEEMRDFFSPLLGARPVKVYPVMVNGNGFEEGHAEVRITNDSDVPMKIDLNLLGNPTLTSTFHSEKLNVSPNSVEMLKFKINGHGFVVDELTPMTLTASVEYLPEKMASLKMDYAIRINPEKKEALAVASNPVNVDGDLSEWPTLKYKDNPKALVSDPHSHQGDRSDGSFRFDVSYDNQFLYLAAEVTDDEILVSDGSRPVNQDGLHVLIDGAPESVSALRTNIADVLYLAQSPSGNDDGNEKLYLAERLPAGTKSVTVTTSEGYRIEMAVPLEYIRTLQGSTWSTVRINVAVTDFDRDYRHTSTLWWKPDWRGKDTYAGSGLFYK